MKINVKRINDAVYLKGVNESGNELLMDGSPDVGGKDLAMTHMQILLTSLGGCTSIDVLSILKKMQQEVTDYYVEIDGQREKVGEANLFKNIHLIFTLSGKLDEKK